MLAARGRVAISVDYRAWVKQALTVFPIREAALTHEVSLASLEIELPHRDPADRFLAATAVVYEHVLVTLDRRLRGARGLRTLYR